MYGFYNRRGGPTPCPLSHLETFAILCHWANPDKPIPAIAKAVGMAPGELRRALKLKAGSEMLGSLIRNFSPAELMPECDLTNPTPGSLPTETILFIGAFERERFMREALPGSNEWKPSQQGTAEVERGPGKGSVGWSDG